MSLDDYLPPHVLEACDAPRYASNGQTVTDDGVCTFRLSGGALLMTGMSCDIPIPGWLEASYYVNVGEWC